MRKLSLIFAQLVLVSCLSAQVPGEIAGRVLLPNGWWLSPVGEQIPLGDLPMNAALTEDEAFLAIAHGGQSKAQVMLVDVKRRKVVQSVQLGDCWQGIAFLGNRLFVSGGYKDCVYTFRLKNGKLVAEDSIMFVDRSSKRLGAAAGLDVQGSTLAVVFKADSTLRVPAIFRRTSKR